MTNNCTPCRPTAKVDLLVLCVLCFAIGIGLIQWHPFKHVGLAWISLVLLGGGLLVIPSKKIPPVVSLALLTLLFFTAGIIHGNSALKPPKAVSHIYHQIDKKQEVSLMGVLARMPAKNDETTTLSIHTDHLIQQQTTTKTEGIVRLKMPGSPPPDLLPGDRLIARATVSRIRPPSTPGAFDYRAYLARQSIWIKGWVAAPVFLSEIHSASPAPALTRLRYLPEKIRHRLSNFLDKTVDAPNRGLYKALLLGEKSEIDKQTLENYKAAGIMHLLAISGLHMGLLALCCLSLFTWLLKRSPALLLAGQTKKIAALLTLPPLTAYAFIAGFQTPVIRSLIMVAVFVLALTADRQRNLITAICIAAFGILLVTPEALGSLSFQLSFAAIFSIACFMPVIIQDRSAVYSDLKHRWFKKMIIWLRAALLVSAAAMAGTLPLQLYHFNRFSPLSPFTTLLVEPFLCIWALLLGLVATIALPFSPLVAGLLFKVGSWGILVASHLTSILASLPFASVWLPTPGFWEIFFFYLLLLSLVFWKMHRLIPLAAGACMLLIACGPLKTLWDIRTSSDAQVSIIDVGPGSASVLQLPGGHTILIDCGTRSRNFEVGSRLLAPFLWKQGITRIDQIVISHPHADHFNGVGFLLEHFRPEVFWVNGTAPEHIEYTHLLERAKELGIEIRIPLPGEVLYEKRGARLVNLAEHRSVTQETNFGERGNDLSINQQSLVIRLEHGRNSFLFPGDIDQQVENQLLQAGLPVKADILLAAHHGAATSNSETFLDVVSPAHVIVSDGKRKLTAGYCFEKREGNHFTSFHTATHGTVSFISDGRTWTARPFLENSSR